MELKLLNEKEKNYAENLGKNLARGSVKGLINLADELEKLRKVE